MSYYPIKCIQCLRPIREAERCVKLTKDEIRSGQIILRESGSLMIFSLMTENLEQINLC